MVPPHVCHHSFPIRGGVFSQRSGVPRPHHNSRTRHGCDIYMLKTTHNLTRSAALSGSRKHNSSRLLGMKTHTHTHKNRRRSCSVFFLFSFFFQKSINDVFAAVGIDRSLFRPSATKSSSGWPHGVTSASLSLCRTPHPHPLGSPCPGWDPLPTRAGII